MKQPVVLAFAALTALTLVACSKGPLGADAGDAGPQATVVDAGAPDAAADAGAIGTTPVKLAGTYSVEAGALYVPDGGDWANTRWRNDSKNTDALGDGTLTLDVDADGRAHGEGAGALGAFVVDGVVALGELTASITRKDPTDLGFTGTLVGRVPDAGTGIEGTMALSILTDAHVIRKGTFTLKR